MNGIPFKRRSSRSPSRNSTPRAISRTPLAQARERGFDKITHRRCRHASRRDRQLPRHGRLHQLDGGAAEGPRQYQRGPAADDPAQYLLRGSRRPGAAVRRAQARKDAGQCAPRHHAHAPFDGRRWVRPTACSIRPPRMRLAIQPKRDWEFYADARLQPLARQRSPAAGAAAQGHALSAAASLRRLRWR